MFWFLIVSVVFLVYWLNNRCFNYWTNRKFKQCEPTFILGTMKPFAFQHVSMGEHFAEIYNKFKGNTKVVGMYMLYKPTLLVTDAKIVQDVLIRDFSSFHDKPMPVDENRDPISAHLFSVSGQKWRDLRVKLVSDDSKFKESLTHTTSFIHSHQHSQVANSKSCSRSSKIVVKFSKII
jgi:cytochrome P450 family 6